MHVHFLGEPDNGIRPSSQWARALSSLGLDVTVSAEPEWDRQAWHEVCNRCDVIHLITYSQNDHRLLRKLWQARKRGVALVRTWVGSDCLWALHHRPTRRFAHDLARLGTLQLTVADHLTDELAQIGLPASTIPSIAPGLVSEGDPPPWPERFSVLCYLPSRRRVFYGGAIFDGLVEAFPEVDFVVLCDGETDYRDRPNVTSIDHADNMAAVVARCSVLVRPAMHDGMPKMVLEVLSLGRQVIASHEYPHCHCAHHPQEYAEILRAIQRQPQMNVDGCRHVRTTFAVERTIGVFLDRLLSQIKHDRADRRRLGRRQAMAMAVRRPGMFTGWSATPPRVADLPQEAIALRGALQGRGGPITPTAGDSDGHWMSGKKRRQARSMSRSSLP